MEVKLNEKMSALIEDKGVTAYEVSIASTVPHSTLSRILSGESEKLSIKNKKKLSDYFKVDEDYFNNGNKTKVKSSNQYPNIESGHEEHAYLKGLTDELFKYPYFIERLEKHMASVFSGEDKKYKSELAELLTGLKLMKEKS